MKEFEKKCMATVREIAEELDELAANPQNRNELDNGEATDLYCYFEDALDVEYHIGGDGEYRGVAVTIATGGPHIEIDTNDMAVKLWWGGETAEWSISRNTAEAIDDIFCEYYQAIR